MHAPAEVEALVAGAGARSPSAARASRSPPRRAASCSPARPASVEAALQLADRRMYANKSQRARPRPARSRATSSSPPCANASRELAEQAVDVGELARAVAVELGMERRGARRDLPRRPTARRPARWRSPTRSSTSPGPLEDSEWEFIREHTADRRADHRLGGGARAGRPPGPLEPASAGTAAATPTACAASRSRSAPASIAVCDAYEAMISERPYSVAMRPARALEELRRGARNAVRSRGRRGVRAGGEGGRRWWGGVRSFRSAAIVGLASEAGRLRAALWVSPQSQGAPLPSTT